MTTQTTSLRTFYILVLTQTLSLIGSRMTGLAIGIWVFTETGVTTPLMIVAALQTLPYMLGGSLAGVFADRWNRKRIIMVTDAAQAIPTFLLMLAFMSGEFQLWMLYLGVLVQASFEMFQAPVVTASTSMMVPESELDRANTIRQLSGPAAGLIAPTITGFLYAVIGVSGVMSIDLATFLIAVAVVSTLTIPQPTQSTDSEDDKGSVWQELRGGFRFLWRRPALLALVFFATFINFILNGNLTLSVPYILSITDSEAMVGLGEGIMNLGMLAGGILFSVWGGWQKRMHTVMVSIAMMAIMMIFYGVARSPVVLMIVLFLILFPNPAINSLFMSMLQVKTPPAIQGRVFALVMQVAMLATPLSLLLTGGIVDQIMEPAVGEASWWGTVAPLVGSEPGSGMGLLMVISGAMLAIATVIFFSFPAIRNLEENLPDYRQSSATNVDAESEPESEFPIESAVPAL